MSGVKVLGQGSGVHGKAAVVALLLHGEQNAQEREVGRDHLAQRLQVADGRFHGHVVVEDEVSGNHGWGPRDASGAVHQDASTGADGFVDKLGAAQEAGQDLKLRAEGVGDRKMKLFNAHGHLGAVFQGTEDVGDASTGEQVTIRGVVDATNVDGALPDVAEG